MLQRFRLKAAQGCRSTAGSSWSASSVSNPKISSGVVSRAASSASANNDPSQQSPHPIHNTFAGFGFMDAGWRKQLVTRVPPIFHSHPAGEQQKKRGDQSDKRPPRRQRSKESKQEPEGTI